MKSNNQSIIQQGGVTIGEGAMVYVGGDLVGRDKITVFDSAVISFFALGASNLFSWLRLAGAAAILGLFVAAVSQRVFGGAVASDSAAVSILHGAVGALIGGLIAWYSLSLPVALIRVAWVEGGLVMAEWLFARLFPGTPTSVPAWFGLPILHASMLVALIAGPWLALITFALIRLFGPGSRQPINRRWRAEAISIVSACLASGLIVVIAFGSIIDDMQPPVDPSVPPVEVPSTIPPDYLSGPLPPGAHDGYTEYTRLETHQEGFIMLPGWLKLSQAVAILIMLVMIVPVSAALTSGWPPLRETFRMAVIGFVVSAAIGVGLDFAATSIHADQIVLVNPYELSLSGPVITGALWGIFGLVGGLAAGLVRQLLAKIDSKKP